MELEEIKSRWHETDDSISKSIKINRNVMHEKLRQSFSKLKIKRLLLLLMSCITVPLVLVMIVYPRIVNDGSAWFYISLISFFTPIIVTFIAQIYYYTCLLKIDFTEPILKTQKTILKLESFEKKLNVCVFIICPIIIIGAFKIFNISISKDSILFMVLIALSMIISTYIRLRITIPKEFKKIKTHLSELEDLKSE
ncbi:hypothetical protein [Dysgonomonas sp. ZJ709]|uniref:hypothetical protein n=1 Tax=Dysgonomonas sp. ZJ709 TaxID=2709797 RepID=UPI0013EBCD6D|nr:hypothetical protein [Dysgonomonas sp. ZJ709]